MMEQLIPKVLGGAIVASGSIAVVLSSNVGGLPEAPPAKDPLTWAFMVIVGAVVMGAGWIIKYTLQNNNQQNIRLAEKLEQLGANMAEFAITAAKLGEHSAGLGVEVRRLAREIDGLATACPLISREQPTPPEGYGGVER